MSWGILKLAQFGFQGHGWLLQHNLLFWLAFTEGLFRRETIEKKHFISIGYTRFSAI